MQNVFLSTLSNYDNQPPKMLIHMAKDSNKKQTLSTKKPQQQGQKNGHPLIPWKTSFYVDLGV